MPLQGLSALKQLLRGLFSTVKFQGEGTCDAIIMVRKGTAYILNWHSRTYAITCMILVLQACNTHESVMEAYCQVSASEGR